MATAGVGRVMRSVEQKWQQWLNTIYYYEASDEPVTTAEWMTYLVEDDLLPCLDAKGYMLSIPDRRFIEKLLNHLYSFEKDYMKGHFPRTYNSTPHRAEDYEYFFNKKFPDAYWKNLAKNNAVEWYADGDEFASRVWIELPFWVAQYIDFRNSPVTEELNNLLVGTAEEETMIEEPKKKELDPYVQDYYY